jgi:hypothetical protein
MSGWRAPCPGPLRPPPPRRSRKTLIYLILTLNHIYPDYDFSQLRAQHFRKEASLAAAEEAIDTRLLEVSKVRPGAAAPTADASVPLTGGGRGAQERCARCAR